MNISEDEIDLTALFNVLKIYKLYIFLITTIVAIGGIFFIFSKPPVYEAKVIVKIGEYKLPNSNFTMIENPNIVVSNIKTLFLKTSESIIKSVRITRNTVNSIEIVAHAEKSEIAVKEIEKVSDFVILEHSKILANIKSTVKKIDDEPSSNYKLLMIKKKIKLYENQIEIYTHRIKQYSANNKNVLPIFILNDSLFKFNIELLNSQIEKFNIEISNKRTFESFDTRLVRDITFSQQSIDRNIKTSIILITLIAFIMSIFIVFFINHINVLKARQK